MTSAVAITLCILLLLAAWSDVRGRVLPNWLAGLILLTAIAGGLFTQDWAALGYGLAHAAVALAVGFGLFAIGWIGGGDAKTYAALAASIPISSALSLMLWVAIAMFAVAFPWIIISRMRRRALEGTPEELKGEDRYAKIPLGVAIAAGGMAQIWTSCQACAAAF